MLIILYINRIDFPKNFAISFGFIFTNERVEKFRGDLFSRFEGNSKIDN